MGCANARNIQSYLCRTSVCTYYSTVYTLTLPPAALPVCPGESWCATESFDYSGSEKPEPRTTQFTNMVVHGL